MLSPPYDTATGVAPPEDQRLLEALLAGDEAAFVSLVDAHHASLVRLAMVYVGDRAVAEEVAQETWLGVLGGLDRFEGRSSLKTWIFRILTNRAITRGERERRVIPFSALAQAEVDATDPAVEPERFLPPDHAEWPGHWSSAPKPWGDDPQRRLLAREVDDCIRSAVDELPPGQRAVIVLRDMQGFGSDEACDVLGITEGNQRVLLHRARSKVRRALERYFADE
jgi:RNA polymerase sigma-70 factor (ECF subfamily)